MRRNVHRWGKNKGSGCIIKKKEKGKGPPIDIKNKWRKPNTHLIMLATTTAQRIINLFTLVHHYLDIDESVATELLQRHVGHHVLGGPLRSYCCGRRTPVVVDEIAQASE